MQKPTPPYPLIEDYAFISNCQCVALISRLGSVDWCCMPRLDDDSCFGRLLDWQLGGYCSISTKEEPSIERRYLPGTMILETRFRTRSGTVLLTDFFMMSDGAAGQENNDHVRLVEGIEGEVELRADICPRFDYGEIAPLACRQSEDMYTATGSDKGLVILSDIPLEVVERRELHADFRITAGRRLRFVIHFEPPERIEGTVLRGWREGIGEDTGLRQTRDWWAAWSGQLHAQHGVDEQTRRSATVLKALTFARTGAIAAAATTSLPEWLGAGRNWDYRFSWVRDSVFVVRALHELGCEVEADAFLRFIRRSSAGSAAELQIMYGVDGKRRLTEVELGWMDGYCGSKPVRIGNLAAKQVQLDVYGAIMALAWEWHSRDRGIDQAYWDFLQDVLGTVCGVWEQPDHGIWERRGAPLHHVHSKAMCWSALDHGIRLAEERELPGALEQWRRARDAIREAIETRGYDDRRGIFVQAFENKGLDASLLLLGAIGFVDYRDPRMLRTADAICKELDRDGLIQRYNTPDGLRGPEGAFLPCTFWMASCLARQGCREEAIGYYRRALACANDLGLMPEEFDPESKRMLGNFPQALTHVSQIMAYLALQGASGPASLPSPA